MTYACVDLVEGILKDDSGDEDIRLDIEACANE